MALSTILLLVHYSCAAPVMDMQDPFVVWKSLKKHHQTVSQARRDSLLARYQATNMKPSKTVLELRALLSTLECQLGGIVYIASESEQLRALPQGWSTRTNRHLCDFNHRFAFLRASRTLCIPFNFLARCSPPAFRRASAIPVSDGRTLSDHRILSLNHCWNSIDC